MRILPPETWEEIRKAYVETTEPIRQIANRYGIGASTVSQRALREGWPLRKPPGVQVVAPPPARPLAKPGNHAMAERTEPREPDTADARIRRMLGIIDLQLDQMESRMTSGQPMTTQDEERQARAFAAIAGNLEKVTEAAADIFREPGHDAAGNGSGQSDAQRMRREIAERLERLNAQWLAREVLAELPPEDVERLYYDWLVWARDGSAAAARDSVAASRGGCGSCSAGAARARRGRVPNGCARRRSASRRSATSRRARIALVGETLA